jgi:hypothetical protein
MTFVVIPADTTSEMVYFVCESCQETLKKNQVDIHASRCRGCWAVSCVDCSKVFEGDSYKEVRTRLYFH